jgi:hypothetical protein
MLVGTVAGAAKEWDAVEGSRIIFSPGHFNHPGYQLIVPGDSAIVFAESLSYARKLSLEVEQLFPANTPIPAEFQGFMSASRKLRKQSGRAASAVAETLVETDSVVVPLPDRSVCSSFVLWFPLCGPTTVLRR